MPLTADDAPRGRAALRAGVAEAAWRTGAEAAGLVAVGGTSLDLHQPLAPRLVGDRPLPGREPPPVVARVPVDLDPASLADAVDQVPVDALAVVTSAWALSRLRPPRRPAWRDALREVASGRPVAWVSVEGVGVAPGVPTLGDRAASGHSLLALTLLDGDRDEVQVLGRCWSRGAVMSWLA